MLEYRYLDTEIDTQIRKIDIRYLDTEIDTQIRKQILRYENRYAKNRYGGKIDTEKAAGDMVGKIDTVHAIWACMCLLGQILEAGSLLGWLSELWQRLSPQALKLDTKNRYGKQIRKIDTQIREKQIREYLFL